MYQGLSEAAAEQAYRLGVSAYSAGKTYQAGFVPSKTQVPRLPAYATEGPGTVRVNLTAWFYGSKRNQLSSTTLSVDIGLGDGLEEIEALAIDMLEQIAANSANFQFEGLDHIDIRYAFRG